MPYLAHAIAVLAKGHIGTWDPLLFGFLVVNSIFAATTSFLTYIIGSPLLGNSSTALFASALYLLNFAVSNAQLAVLVDCGEALFLMALVVSMFYGRWLLLPLFGVLGTLTKESFVLFSILMVVTWWRLSPGSRRAHAAISVVSMIAVEFAAVIALQSVISGHLVWPWTPDAALSVTSSRNARHLEANQTGKGTASAVPTSAARIAASAAPPGAIKE